MSLKTSTFYNRIKRVMQSDQDVGKVAAGSTYIVACALEAFLDSLLNHGVELASNRGAKLMNSAHIKGAVNADPLLDFCTDIASSAPDLPPEDETRSNRKRVGEANEEDRAVKARRGSRQTKGQGSKRVAGKELKDEERDSTINVPKPDPEAQEQVTKNEVKHEMAATADIALGTSLETLVDFAPGKQAEEEDYDA